MALNVFARKNEDGSLSINVYEMEGAGFVFVDGLTGTQPRTLILALERGNTLVMSEYSRGLLGVDVVV